MSFAGGAPGGLNYCPCRYGRSRVLFRGPRRPLDLPYLAFLGGSETYGRFVDLPFPARVEPQLGLPCVNFGIPNAGLDLYLSDPAVLEAAERAETVVLQILGAQNMSNRFYSVHPRRNDRFLRGSDRLLALYPEVDFSEFHFNRHMLGRLHDLSPERFAQITAELRLAWVARMKHLLALLRGRVVLLWVAEHLPPETPQEGLARDPLFVDRAMLEALRPRTAALLEVELSEAARQRDTEGKVFAPLEAGAAAESLGPLAHAEVAEALGPVLAALRP